MCILPPRISKNSFFLIFGPLVELLGRTLACAFALQTLPMVSKSGPEPSQGLPRTPQSTLVNSKLATVLLKITDCNILHKSCTILINFQRRCLVCKLDPVNFYTYLAAIFKNLKIPVISEASPGPPLAPFWTPWPVMDSPVATNSKVLTTKLNKSEPRDTTADQEGLGPCTS